MSTVVHLVSGNSIKVDGTPDEIAALISEATSSLVTIGAITINADHVTHLHDAGTSTATFL